MAATVQLVVAATIGSVVEGRTLIPIGQGGDSRYQALLLDDVVVLQGEPPDGPLLVETGVCGIVRTDESGGSFTGVVPAPDAAELVPADAMAVWFLHPWGGVESSAYDIVIHPDAAWSQGDPLYRPTVGRRRLLRPGHRCAADGRRVSDAG